MSFAVVDAGRTEDVRAQVLESGAWKYGDELGELTKAFVADVLALVPTAKVIIEASGHADSKSANVSVSVRPVF
jgi:hypothetical protein